MGPLQILSLEKFSIELRPSDSILQRRSIMGLKVATRTSTSAYALLGRTATRSGVFEDEIQEELVGFRIDAPSSLKMSDESVGGEDDEDDDVPDTVGGEDDEDDVMPDSVSGEDGGDVPDTAGGSRTGESDSIGGRHGANTGTMGRGDGDVPDSVGGDDDHDDAQHEDAGAE
jgi:hypothetical protein